MYEVMERNKYGMNIDIYFEQESKKEIVKNLTLKVKENYGKR